MKATVCCVENILGLNETSDIVLIALKLWDWYYFYSCKFFKLIYNWFMKTFQEY